MASPSPIGIDLWRPEPASLDRDLDLLAGILQACVHAGGSVGFMLPFPREEALAFWRGQVLPAVQAGTRLVLLARLHGDIAGTVHLDLGTPPNQPHRAEVRKLLVHPEARRRGIAMALMSAVEQYARHAHRVLLTLDTVTGSPAESIYRSLGYTAIGVIPRYALNFDSTVLEGTTVMYKELEPR